jgi:hypothetical protein
MARPVKRAALKARNSATWASALSASMSSITSRLPGASGNSLPASAALSTDYRSIRFRGRGGHRRQQMAFAAASGSAPDVKRLEAVAFAKVAQALQQFAVGADDEVVQRRRLARA